MLYTQCKMVNGNRHTYGWIPSELAAVGQALTINDERGWSVAEAWGTQSYEAANRDSQKYKKQRAVSDI